MIDQAWIVRISVMSSRLSYQEAPITHSVPYTATGCIRMKDSSVEPALHVSTFAHAQLGLIE